MEACHIPVLWSVCASAGYVQSSRPKPRTRGYSSTQVCRCVQPSPSITYTLGTSRCVQWLMLLYHLGPALRRLSCSIPDEGLRRLKKREVLFVLVFWLLIGLFDRAGTAVSGGIRAHKVCDPDNGCATSGETSRAVVLQRDGAICAGFVLSTNLQHHLR